MGDELDLSTPEARATASRALPALILGSAMGNVRAGEYAAQIMGTAFAEALQPSIDAVHRLAAYRTQRTNQTDRSES